MTTDFAALALATPPSELPIPDDALPYAKPELGLLRIELTPHLEPTVNMQHTDRFDAWLGDELLLTHRQPLYNGARILKDRGVDPGTLLTIRHRGKPYDSTKPLPIDLAAMLTVEESDRHGLRLRIWRPFAGRSPKDAPGNGEGSQTAADLDAPQTAPYPHKEAAP